MKHYQLSTKSRQIGVYADDDIGALDRAADLLEDDDEGNIEEVEDEEVEDYEPEGPG